MTDQPAVRQETGFARVADLWAKPIRHELDVVVATRNTAISDLTMPELIAWGTVIAYTAGSAAILFSVAMRVLEPPRRYRPAA